MADTSSMTDASSTETGDGAAAAFTGLADGPDDDFLAHSARPPNKANETRITKGLIHFNREIFILPRITPQLLLLLLGARADDRIDRFLFERIL